MLVVMHKGGELMGKASRSKRERHEQPGQKPPEQQKAWCDHCLDTLHDSGIGPIGEALLEAYRQMRSGDGLDRKYSHAEAIEWIEGEVGAMISALRSSGEQYQRDCELEYEEAECTKEEFDAWVARDEAREVRRREAS